MMTDREALDQVERLIADYKNRIASQREVIANPSNQRTGTPAQLDAFSLRRTCSAISSMRSSIRASPEPCPLQNPGADLAVQRCVRRGRVQPKSSNRVLD